MYRSTFRVSVFLLTSYVGFFVRLAVPVTSFSVDLVWSTKYIGLFSCCWKSLHVLFVATFLWIIIFSNFVCGLPPALWMY